MHIPVLWVRSRIFISLALFLGLCSVGSAAQPGTLSARLGLVGAPGLELTLQNSDASSARYRVGAPQSVPAVSQTVTAYLVTQGWLEHPNVSEAPTPKPGVVQQLTSFVQGSDLLECRVAKAGSGAVVLTATLISLEAPPQVAAAPYVLNYQTIEHYGAETKMAPAELTPLRLRR